MSEKTILDRKSRYFLDNRKGSADDGTIWRVKPHNLWAWDAGNHRWKAYDPAFTKQKTTELTEITPDQAFSLMTMIKMPLHLVHDAQGPCGIMDDKGQAVCWFSETFTPNFGYVWKPEPCSFEDDDAHTGTTCYSKRNWVVRSILAHLEELLR